MDGRLQFDWDVPRVGYRWILAAAPQDPAHGPQLALVPAEADHASAPTEYRPAAWDPALFLAFAQLRPDQAEILAFANRHGDLVGTTELQPAESAESVSGSTLRGTLLVTWQFQIADMQRLVGLWHLLQQEDRERLTPHILWRKDAKGGLSVHFVSHPAGKGEPSLGFRRTEEVIASRDTRPELLGKFEVGDPIVPAWAYLQGEIDLHLHYAAAEVAALMAWDSLRNRPALRLAAPTLLAAVWLQFADAVSNDRLFSRCRECGKWFVVAPDAARSHRRFCSNKCRSKAYRERQDRARQLFTAGKTFAEIAEQLGSDVVTVRKWVTGFRE
jgi:hypothetical protein